MSPFLKDMHHIMRLRLYEPPIYEMYILWKEQEKYKFFYYLFVIKMTKTTVTNKTALFAGAGALLAVAVLAVSGMNFLNSTSANWQLWNATNEKMGVGSGSMMGAMMWGRMGDGRRWWVKWWAGWNMMGDAMRNRWQSDEAQAAIAANDYDAFVKAITPTREEFATIVATHANRQAIQAALTNNDYNAFVSAWEANPNKSANMTLPTQEQFAQIVARHKQRTAAMEQIDAQ